MEKRRRRKRRRGHSSSNSPKPLSIDMLKKKGHKNAKGKRVASVRLDLDDPGGYSSSGFNRAQLFWKIVALGIVLAAVFAVVSDYGWDKLSSQISGFVSGIGEGAQETVSEIAGSRSSGADAALNEVAQLQGETPADDINVSSTFYPEGNDEAISRAKLAMETAKVGLTSQAIVLLDEAKIIDPDVTGIDFIKATIYAEAQKITKAREYYQLAINQKETQYLALRHLGKLEVEHGNYAAAIPYLVKAQDLKPSDFNITSLYSYALRMNHQLQEGLFEARAAAKSSPESKILEITATLAEIQAGTYEPTPKIITIIENSEVDTSASPYDLVVAAGWEQSRGNTAKVKSYWEVIRPHSVTMRSLKEFPNDPLFILAPTDVTTKKTTVADTPAVEIEPSASIMTEFSEDIPAPAIDLNISMEEQEIPESGFLNLSADPPNTP